MSQDWSDIDNGLLDPQWYANGEPHDAFARLRAEDPVRWVEGSSYGRPFWVVTRYEDVVAVLNDPANFSNYRDTRPPRVPTRLTASELYSQGADTFLTHLDPPLHTLHRQPVEGNFARPSVNELRSSVERVVDDLIRQVDGRGRINLVDELTPDIPMHVLMGFLGVPRDDWEWIRTQVFRVFTPDDPKFAIEGQTAAETIRGARLSIAEYSSKLAEMKRSTPGADFGSVLANTVVDGALLDEHEMTAWLSLLMAAGIQTTRNAAVAGVWLFHQNPGQRASLIADPALIDQAVEEVLRWITPVRSRLRVARFDTRIGDRDIKAGDWVVAFLSSANRDETVFSSPHEFNIQRERRGHLSFGEGIHKCLAMHLVALELGTFFTRFLTSFPNFHIPGASHPSWIADHVLNGFSSLEVELDRSCS